VTASAERMNALIGDFLNVSRLELGTLTADKKNIDLQVLVDKIFDDFTGPVRTKKLTVVKDVRAIHALSDERLLRMMLGNLISNAVKYTPESGSVTITAKTSGRELEIAVSDTGLGIPLNEQDKLFTKLFRASNVRDKVTDGTGLGLYVVKMAAEVLRGSISFTSTEGKGTTFIVRLPQ
jgi:two-component system, OmpR family, phosphate regulon sensor histidine kinase PhoR